MEIMAIVDCFSNEEKQKIKLSFSVELKQPGIYRRYLIIHMHQYTIKIKKLNTRSVKIQVGHRSTPFGGGRQQKRAKSQQPGLSSCYLPFLYLFVFVFVFVFGGRRQQKRAAR